LYTYKVARFIYPTTTSTIYLTITITIIKVDYT